MLTPDVEHAAILSLHTSPLAQPGIGDSGGMNVYVRELAASLAQAGVPTTVYVRRWDDDLPREVSVEPLLDVVHVDAGPSDMPKEGLESIVDDFADGVAADLDRRGGAPVLHANYWLSGVAGHRLKHELSIPLVSTFHTLARVKAAAGDVEPQHRIEAEAAVIACSDVMCASTAIEADQLVELYGADRSRIEIVPPGVDHAFFSPGDQAAARRAVGLGPGRVMLFAGRIQPLKGLHLAIEAMERLSTPDTTLVVVGGPSGSEGEAELTRINKTIAEAGMADRVRFVPPQPHHLLSTYYRAADVCVVPSRSESFGLVALEAAACGTPVVAAAVGGLTALVEDGRTGFLVDSRDPQRWADALDAVLGDDIRREAMASAAAAAGRRYTWSTTAARLRRIYADVRSANELVLCPAA